MSDGEAAGARWDTPEISVRPMRCYVLYFRRTVQRPTLEEVWATHGLPASPAVLDDPSQFISYGFMERVFQVLTDVSGDPQFIDKAGRHVASPEVLGFAYYFLRGLGTPELGYRKTIDLASTYNRVGSFTVERLTATEARLSYRSDIRETSRLACRARVANFAAFPTIWGLPEAQLVETECQVSGGSSCRYHIKWERRPPPGWRRWMFLVVGALAGTAVAPSAPAQWAVVAGALGFLLGGWIDTWTLATSRRHQLDEYTAGLSRSLEELQRRADEIFQANVELDRRVADRTRDLEQALERLRQLDRLKSEFFANVSHELRTPLTLILAPVEERLARPVSEADAALLTSVRSSAHRLLRLIDDLLDLSRIDAGHLRLSVAPVDLASLARHQHALFAQTASARGLTLELDAAGPVDDLWGDLHRLEMIVGNLLGNALKFTPHGGQVRLVVRHDAREASLTVADTGPGIPPEHGARVFERFYQADVGASARRGGVGIGLSLAKNLAELHGGRLVLASGSPGATFTLTLPKGKDHFRPDVVERRSVTRDVRDGRRSTDAPPLSLPHLARAEPVENGPLPLVSFEQRRCRVLVAEDNEELAQLLVQLLSASCEVLVEHDGLAALARARAERPDLVLSDVMMPGMSGFELCHALKADQALASTPVMLLTARSGPDAALEGYASGADEFVEKPFHPRVLLARVHAQLRLRTLGLQVASHARLAAVGTLAAGVGHEVRNPVNAVLNGVKILQQRAGPADDRRLLDVIADGAARIDRISAALLQHVSPADAQGLRPVKVRAGIEASLALLAHRMHGVRVENAVPAELELVASATELNQVFLNLVDNSVRAGAKTIWIDSHQGGARVSVSVADDGPGVKKELEHRLFDLFFTTREPGEGTGLGLSLSRQSIRRQGGDLTYAPRPRGGAIFTVTLPTGAPP